MFKWNVLKIAISAILNRIIEKQLSKSTVLSNLQKEKQSVRFYENIMELKREENLENASTSVLVLMVQKIRKVRTKRCYFVDSQYIHYIF